MTNQAPPPKLPFRLGARQHFTQVGTKPFISGGNVKIDFPAVGWLSRVYVTVRGTTTVTAAAPVATFKNVVEAAWNTLTRVRVEANGAQLTVLDCSGYDLYLASHFLERGFKNDAPGAGSSAVDPELQKGWTPPTTVAVNDFRVTYVLPIAAGNGSNFDVGLINLQAEELTLTLNMDCAKPADIYTANAPVFDNLTIEVGYLWYEMPDANRVELPQPLIVRLVGDQFNEIKTGENRMKAIRQGSLMQQLIVVKTDGDYEAGSVDRILLKLNKNTTVYDMTAWQNRLTNRLQLGVDLPSGVFMWDFYHSSQAVSEGDSRDMFDLEQYATFETIINIPAGIISVPATTNIRTITRTLNTLQG